jgi:hypothetical protein
MEGEAMLNANRISAASAPAFHCRCQGESIHETMGTILALLDRGDLDAELRSHVRALRKCVDSVQKR